ncbi:MAG: excinuclease ABC subunit UvrA [Burkholderiales bacterium]
MSEYIKIRGARQNNLKNLDLDIPLGEIVLVTGVSGSGKSSLVFDTLFAEGQRRYVETFSTYARQFLDRMEKPEVDHIDGIPPAIAISQVNSVKTSRSTVGTITELSDYFKLLFSRLSVLYCHGCAKPVRRDSAQDIQKVINEKKYSRVAIATIVDIPENFTAEEIVKYLELQGYSRHSKLNESTLEVVVDRFKLSTIGTERMNEAIEAAINLGKGRCNVFELDDSGDIKTRHSFSTQFHCASCDLHYTKLSDSHFSFNSPLGACETCRGFGRVIGVDYEAVVNDATKSLSEGAIRPWQTDSYSECQVELLDCAEKYGVPIDIPWSELSSKHKAWVLEGDPQWVDWSKSWPGKWYGVKNFFSWLESKAYKMHIRVLLSRYRSYSTCHDCGGSRLKPNAMYWRFDPGQEIEKEISMPEKLSWPSMKWSAEQLSGAVGFSIHDFSCMPVYKLRLLFSDFLKKLDKNSADEPTQVVLSEIQSRLTYLEEVGLGYLQLDRQSRTLSGGELQRVNLTTALGASLTQTLFLLDEPSVGLHSKDIDRVISVMRRLKARGNSIVVVEHDPQIMLEADQIIDMGPGAGELGGRVTYFGTPSDLYSANSLTAQYIRGEKSVGTNRVSNKTKITDWLSIENASTNNLKNVSARFPLGKICCITGVSGSGKSSLLRDELFTSMDRLLTSSLRQSSNNPLRIKNFESLRTVAFLDQSPIGKSSRSNPISYVGAFDGIRELFAKSADAKTHKFDKSFFSFNSGKGRCHSCAGSGFEHIEMQFLSDVYLKCPACDGKRFRDEVLAVGISLDGDGKKNISDILNMTVSEAVSYFRDEQRIVDKLKPLCDVGLEYIRLGQPVPTLSGGEAQRLKLASYLARDKKRKDENTLFMLDEPTTGLHLDDVAKLVSALDTLAAQGHTVILVEHNLDVIACSDWVVDLGPEGGDRGGRIVAMGTPKAVSKIPESFTGQELDKYFKVGRALQVNVREHEHDPSFSEHGHIVIKNARENNLRELSAEIPRGKITVISGVSGSGKSTLAFDIVFGEGQRRYLESLNAYARQFIQAAKKPDLDVIYGIPPTVAIEQRTSQGGSKSTVGTQTEIYHYLRLLFSKIGQQYCPDCDVAINAQSQEEIVEKVMRDYVGQHVGFFAPLVVARKGLYKDLADSYAKKGFPFLLVDGVFLPTNDFPRLDRFLEHSIDLPVADLVVSETCRDEIERNVEASLNHGTGFFRIISPIHEALDGGEYEEQFFSVKSSCPSCRRSFQELDPRQFSFNSKYGWCQDCVGMGITHPARAGKFQSIAEEIDFDQTLDTSVLDGQIADCPSCNGTRINEVSRSVRWRGYSMGDLVSIPIRDLEDRLYKISLGEDEQVIAGTLLGETFSRLRFLREVGLSYLSLNRSAPTLSGGEAQRIRLAAQLGSNLTGAAYVLDEPTIGLHPADNRMLLESLRNLKEKGNTVVIVEHDEETITMADYLLDLGPGAGSEGGQIIAKGTLKDILDSKQSITGKYLLDGLKHYSGKRYDVTPDQDSLIIRGASANNLKNIDVVLPLRALTVVTGVSGSGKSTLLKQVLLRNCESSDVIVSRKLFHGCISVEGGTSFSRIIEVDQSPIGKTSRSCPATYTGIWDEVRNIFSLLPESRARGYSAARFSFNTPGGRCSACDGQGYQKIEMSFLPDVRSKCESCEGNRFDTETLSVKLRGKSIGDVLNMSIRDAVELFSAYPKIGKRLQMLDDLGLGYLSLGQNSNTLSGGEAQRIKLVSELARSNQSDRRGKNRASVIVLDEPTVGLHMADVEKLIKILHALVDSGSTVFVIEHNLDVIRNADWIVDLGPGPGDEGGSLVYMGSVPGLIKSKTSKTAEAIRQESINRKRLLSTLH